MSDNKDKSLFQRWREGVFARGKAMHDKQAKVTKEDAEQIKDVVDTGRNAAAGTMDFLGLEEYSGKVRAGNKYDGRDYGPPSSLKSDDIPMADRVAGLPGEGGPVDEGGRPRRSIPPISLGGAPQAPDLDSIWTGAKNPNVVMANWEGRLREILGEQSLSPQQADRFETELRGIRETFADAKDTLEKRELAHTLAEALTQIGAGAYGLKTGTDMSNVKLKDHDFSKDLALLQDQLKTDLADLRGRREEDIKKGERRRDEAFKVAQMSMEQDKTAAEQDHRERSLATNAALQKYATDVSAYNARLSAAVAAQGQAINDAYRQDALEARQLQNEAETITRLTQAHENRLQKMGKELQDAWMVMEKKGFNADARANAVMAILPPNVPQEEVRKELFESKWFGLSSGPKSEDEFQAGVSNLLRKWVRPTLTYMNPQTGRLEFAQPKNIEDEQKLRANKWR